MKNEVRIMKDGISYKAIVYGKKSQIIDEHVDSDLRIVLVVAKKMKEIYKIENIWSDIDVLEAILETVRDNKNMETIEE